MQKNILYDSFIFIFISFLSTVVHSIYVLQANVNVLLIFLF